MHSKITATFSEDGPPPATEERTRERLIREVVEGITCTGPDGPFVQIRAHRALGPHVFCVVTQQELLDTLLPAARLQDRLVPPPASADARGMVVEVRRAVGKATPGPWRTATNRPLGPWADDDTEVRAADGSLVLSRNWKEACLNAYLIAHAPTWLIALCDALAASEAAREEAARAETRLRSEVNATMAHAHRRREQFYAERERANQAESQVTAERQRAEKAEQRVSELETGEPVNLAMCGVKGDTVPVADVAKIAGFAVHLATKRLEKRLAEIENPAVPPMVREMAARIHPRTEDGPVG